MEKKLFFLPFLLVWGTICALPNAWINEIHYDNEGTDQNEFVEVIVESPETVSLGDLALYMYNGYDGKIYCLDTVDEFTIGNREGCYQFYTWYQRGIQNDMEGMVLVYHDSLVDIIAYEGSFTGTQAPAAGQLFPDVGTFETGSSSISSSIYLSGVPGSAWEQGTATPGALNTGQELSEIMTPVELEYFYALTRDQSVLLCWQSASETENSRYCIYRNGLCITFIDGMGTSSMPNIYRFEDKKIKPEIEYTYILSDIAFDGRESFLDTLQIGVGNFSAPIKPFLLAAPYPNPFNPSTTIPVEIYAKTKIQVDIINLKGQQIQKLYHGAPETGILTIPIDMQNLPSGRYWIRCTSAKYIETAPIVLLK